MEGSIAIPGRDRTRDAARRLRPVRAWLYLIAALVAIMVLVGGATRLTESGLSITEWRPVTGALPPLSEAAWESELEKYRQTTEYQQINRGMSLEDFKTIYWWEWGHRFLGRAIGIVFLIPFLYFVAARRLRGADAVKAFALFVAGGAQGALGWWMVTSGLVGRVDVSQYRLTAHLCLAFAILGYALWLAMTIGRDRVWRWTRESRAAAALLALLFLQIAAGGIVAGMNAGLASDTWPLMGGRIVPEGMWELSPAILNFTENPLTAQFFHRMLGYILTAMIVAHAVLALRRSDAGAVRASAIALLALVALQLALGVVTVLTGTQIAPALAHQAGAVALFTAAVWHLRNAGRVTS
jgi:cytochrome c oxidase assembly protein subunit 15